jgi:hypothetical protein
MYKHSAWHNRFQQPIEVLYELASHKDTRYFIQCWKSNVKNHKDAGTSLKPVWACYERAWDSGNQSLHTTAKGRIERVWQTFQDRLVVEMRLAGIRDKASAQIFLKSYLQKHNAQFGRKPRIKESLFRKAPSKSILDDILCRKEFRVVQNDHTVSCQTRILQIPKLKAFRKLTKKLWKSGIVQME